MSYVRGEIYIWPSATQTYFWSSNGDDEWRESVWAAGFADRKERGARLSGVGLPQDIVDAFVVMRFAELVNAGELHAAIAGALERGGGNGGCAPLQRLADSIRTAFPEPDIGVEHGLTS